MGGLDPQLYITAFLMLMFSAPILVGIVTPLISRIIQEEEKERYAKFKNLRQKAKELWEKRSDNEFSKAQEELREETDAYKLMKRRTRLIDVSLYLSILIVLICGVMTYGLLNIPFGTAEFYQMIFCVLFMLFLVEIICLFVPMARHIKRIRQNVTRKLEGDAETPP